MKYEREFKKTATFPIVNRKRTLVFVDVYSDEQLMKLGLAMQAALGAKYVGFTAVDGDGNATHAVSVEWTPVDIDAEVAIMDGVIVTWMENP